MGTQYTSTEMLTVEDAQKQILELSHLLEPERVSMLDASGRVLARDIVSDINISPFDNSGMDGFALQAADIAEASPDAPARLKIIGEIGAGDVYDGVVNKGEALRIMTGAPVPEGADTVVKIEDTEVLGETEDKPEGAELIITKPIPLGKNVRAKGEDARAGEVLLKAGTTLHPAGVGLLAATGNSEVEVYRRPRVAVLSSGNELVGPEVLPGPGQIRNSNCYALAAAAKAAGAEVEILGIVRDDEDEIRSVFKKAAQGFELVMISGGAAEGDYDYTLKLIKELGTVYFSKVNMRPGKAQVLGMIDGTLFFGLAGNPAAAMVGFEVLLRPALRKMQGFTKIMRPLTRARLTVDASKPDARRFYIRARLEHDIETNEYLVTPAKNQSSALLISFQNSNCLVVLPEGLTGNAKGETVACLRLDVSEGVII